MRSGMKVLTVLGIQGCGVQKWPFSEIILAVAITVASYEKGGLEMHVAQSEFVDSFVQTNGLEDLQI